MCYIEGSDSFLARPELHDQRDDKYPEDGKQADRNSYNKKENTCPAAISADCADDTHDSNGCHYTSPQNRGASFGYHQHCGPAVTGHINDFRVSEAADPNSRSAAPIGAKHLRVSSGQLLKPFC